MSQKSRQPGSGFFLRCGKIALFPNYLNVNQFRVSYGLVLGAFRSDDAPRYFTIFVVGHKNQIARGALLLVSDKPLTPEGVKTSESDARVSRDWSDVHLSIGIDSLTDIGEKGEMIKHFQY